MEKILFTVIEGNNNNINNNYNLVKTPRLYEEEAIECFTNWRKNAGILKDIRCICYAPTLNLPCADTILELEKLKVEYVQKYHEISDKMECGFFLIPLIGSIIEEENPGTHIIHIDLDMNIIKEIPCNLFSDKTYIGQYDNISSLTQRKHPTWKNPLDTGFTISPTDSKFYSMYWNTFKDLYFTEKYKTDNDWIKQKADNGIYFLEEFVADKLYNLNIFDITPIQHYQLGEGYASTFEYTDIELNKVLFWHEHILADKNWETSKTRQKIDYFKRKGI